MNIDINIENFLNNIKQHRLITIAGLSATGKTSLLISMCHYLILKKNDIYLINVKNQNNLNAINLFFQMGDDLINHVKNIKDGIIVIDDVFLLNHGKGLNGFHNFIRDLTQITYDNNITIIITNSIFVSLYPSQVGYHMTGGNITMYSSSFVGICSHDNGIFEFKVEKSRDKDLISGSKIANLSTIIFKEVRKEKIQKILQ